MSCGASAFPGAVTLTYAYRGDQALHAKLHPIIVTLQNGSVQPNQVSAGFPYLSDNAGTRCSGDRPLPTAAAW